ncbi:MAG: tRNA 2-selenouridine(34) synthase MnmH [Bacteroidia bacterium]
MNSEALAIHDFLARSENRLLIDVRAPVEFEKGHIPGAINIALFDDTERAEIGTLYKQNGKQEAVLRGFEIVAPKLAEFIRTAKASSDGRDVFVYCFRGGMRSNSFGWLMNTAGLNARILKGGYKAYRNFVLNEFATPRKLMLLGGSTGSGKTEILKALSGAVQVIDLEAIARHKGSAFGGIGQATQLSQQLFEHELHNAFSKKDQSQFILLEDESMAIGYNKIPYPLWLQMKSAPVIRLIVPFELRVKRLVKDYGAAPSEKLKQSLLNIASQIGPKNTKDCLEMIDKGQMDEVARITLGYYDKAYEFNYSKKEKSQVIELSCDTDDIALNAANVKQAMEEYGNR